MNKLGRRSFLKVMGQSATILGIGLSQRKVWAKPESQDSAVKTKKRSKRITVEEHISFPELSKYRSSHQEPQEMKMPWEVPGQMPKSYKGTPISNPNGKAENIELRIKDMDEDGIDMQVLSSTSVDEYDLPDAINLARKTNNNLAEIIHKFPNRFSAFCAIPWQDPTAAIIELERAVKELGLKGIKVDGTVKGDYLDAKKYWPIFQKAEALGTPIFIHPEDLRGDKAKPYLDYPGLSGAGWGYAMDIGTQAARLIVSGLFDEFQNLKIVLGHMGEGLPYWSWRLDHHGPGSLLKKWPSEYIRSNFYVATSGHFDHPALVCSCMAVGADHVLFGVDYPVDSNKDAVEFMETAPISDSDKEKIYHLNAEKIFRL